MAQFSAQIKADLTAKNFDSAQRKMDQLKQMAERIEGFEAFEVELVGHIHKEPAPTGDGAA